MLLIQAIRLAIEGFTVFQYFNNIYQKKRSGVTIFFSFSIAYLFLVFLSELNNAIVNSAFSILFDILLADFCFECKFTSSIFHNLLIFVLIAVTEFIPYTFLTSMAMHDPGLSTIQLDLMNALLSKTLFFVFGYFISHYIADRKMNIDTWKQLLFLSILPAATSVMLVGIYTLLQNQKSLFNVYSPTYYLPIIGAVLLLIANIFVLVFYDHLSKTNRELYLLQISKERNKLDYLYFETLKENYQQSRVLIHDISNHLLTIQSMALQVGDHSVNTYIQNLQSSKALSYNPIFSDNEAMNVILNYEKIKCDRMQIKMTIINEGIYINYVSDIDICSILANALDNAIEAAEHSQKKKIDVLLYCQNDAFSVISITNSCDQSPQFENGHPISNKKDSNLHGIGLISIENTLKKYYGQVEYKYDSSQMQFNTLILIPY